MKIGFYSCMNGMPWGGSEELWSRVAHVLLQEQHQVTACFRYWKFESEKLSSLRDAGAKITIRADESTASLTDRFADCFRHIPSNSVAGIHQRRLKQIDDWLDTERPDYLLITVGYHADRIAPAQACINRGIPYAINLQCANTNRFIDDHFLDEFRSAYSQADRVYFVSQENLDKLEMNLALKLPNTERIDNPFGVRLDTNLPWPDTSTGFRLACVGRLHFMSKGQDLLVDVLRQDKWRKRELTITLYGDVQENHQLMQELIKLHQLESKLRIAGFVDDVQQIWQAHHGLILPSRYEGAALAVVEAMMCNRICVTTDVGRNRELIEDNRTGFIAAAPTASLLDDALERAWQARQNWQPMGELAGQEIRKSISSDPVADFYGELADRATGRHP